jgi:hypothetical protein
LPTYLHKHALRHQLINYVHHKQRIAVRALMNSVRQAVEGRPVMRSYGKPTHEVLSDMFFP